MEFESIDLVKDTPSATELKDIYDLGDLDIDKYFNSRGKVYKELNLKEKLKDMSLEEKLELLSSDGLLIKRPLLVTENTVLLGFKEEEYRKLKK